MTGDEKIGTLTCIIILLLGPIFVTPTAQNITDLPPNEANNRFFTDQLVNQRPALSIVGFRGNDASNGYSLKQILGRVYDQNSYSDKSIVREVFSRVITDAQVVNIEDPVSADGNVNRSIVEENSHILQHLAFTALTSYILEQNDINPQTPPTGVEPLPTASQAMSNLKSGLLTLVNQYGVLAQPSGDEVKRTRSLENIARAVDLYLALENAHGYYNNITDWSTAPVPELLSASEKLALFNLFEDDINSLEAGLTTNEVPGTGVQRDEVEPGNSPLKMYSALGLATMSMQQSPSNSFTDFSGLLDKAIGRAGDFAYSDQRKHYWNYQTDTGKYFWAEGPYYMQFAISSVVPFWHAVRANGHLNMLSHGQDPFNSFWFIDPLSWLSKITMPGGYTPPLDDGNKHEVRTASILRWRTVYGDGTVGKRFSWIANELNSSTNGIGLNNNLYLVELAIPRTDQDILPPSSYGNTQPSQTGENGKQQIVIRRANNQYVLLNGESGDAIIRGEGHEQGDNMQLLYNVGDISYLMDSGYDRVETETRLWDWIKGDTWSKSNWNNYRDHNVSVGFPPFLDIKNGYESSGELNVGGYFGGIEYPDLDGTRVNSNHHSTEELYLQTNGNIDILNGKTSLFTYDRNGNKYEFGDYRRRAIFINDGSDSYLIDMNMLETDGGVTGNGNWLLHSYHINSQTLKYNPESDGFSLFQNIDQRQNKHLFLFPARVERDAVGDGAVSIFDDTAEEEFQDNKSIKRVDIWAGYGFRSTIISVSYDSFISKTFINI